MRDVRMLIGRSWQCEGKAAEDSGTPKCWRVLSQAATSARFWSAAVLCRFVLAFSDMENFNYATE